MTRQTNAKIFGKSLAEYLAFQKVPLALVAAVGLARLVLSVAGLTNTTVTWVSMTAVGWAAVLYYGASVHRRGFGSYKQLLPLVAIQAVIVQIIAVVGILLSIGGVQNIYAAPEFSGPLSGPEPNQWLHAIAHLTIGLVASTLVSWGVASVVLLIANRVSRRRALV